MSIVATDVATGENLQWVIEEWCSVYASELNTIKGETTGKENIKENRIWKATRNNSVNETKAVVCQIKMLQAKAMCSLIYEWDEGKLLYIWLQKMNQWNEWEGFGNHIMANVLTELQMWFTKVCL